MRWDDVSPVHIDGMADRPNGADLERAREALLRAVCRLSGACQTTSDNFLARTDGLDKLQPFQPRADDNH